MRAAIKAAIATSSPLSIATAIISLLALAAATPPTVLGAIALVISLVLASIGLWQGRAWWITTAVTVVIVLRLALLAGTVQAPMAAVLAGLACWLASESTVWSFAARGQSRFSRQVFVRRGLDLAWIAGASLIAAAIASAVTSDRTFHPAFAIVGSIVGPALIFFAIRRVLTAPKAT